MIKKTLTAILVATTLFGFNANSFAQGLNRTLNQEPSIGAVMNRLEFTSNNLTASSENLQSAESNYSDADMASEFSNNNITFILVKAKAIFGL